MKKLKKRFATWLLKDSNLPFGVCYNNLLNSQLTLDIKLIGSVKINDVELPEGMELVIRKIKL